MKIPSNYWLGIIGLAFIICLSAYLLIYNILYLSVSGKIRYYGLLQSLGMTQKTACLLHRKDKCCSSQQGGVAIGILSGALFCIQFVPYILNVSGIATGNIEMQCNPAIFLITILVTGLSILIGMRKPIRIATGVTPVEATKYRGSAPKRAGYKKKKGAFFWRMALEQLKQDKKKTIVVLLSLATSLSVFYCLTTIISSQGERTVLPNYWDADLIVRNHTQVTEDIHSLQPAIDNTFLSEIENMDGVKDFHVVEGVPVTFSV